MCGICGVYGLDGALAQREDVERMCGLIRHRGPDGSGLFVDGPIGLGHRRLSIIDLEGGGQPIGNEDGRIQVVFNGEIYNFVELRAELEGLGHLFKTRSDTEVIVHAYEQWGVHCVRRFNGMFAFALWDGPRRKLFLARDHLGVKPLYYAQIGQMLVFASEVKALLSYPHCPRELDVDGLAALFTFRYVPSPGTLFKKIGKLPAGHLMVCEDNKVTIERYWKWVPKIDPEGDERVLVERYQSLLEDAVRLQLRSDVPLGLFLSSGVDSGALLALMQQHLPGSRAQTFTIGFEGGERTNEIADAAKVARQFGADHASMMVSAKDYEQYFHRYMQDIEEPVGHEAAPAFYFVSKIAGQHVKVALTGQGADEPWAGYGRYAGVKLSSIYSRLPQGITRAFAGLLGRLPMRSERLKRGLVSLGETDLLTRFTKIYSFFSADMKAALFKGDLALHADGDAYRCKESLRSLQRDVQHLDPVSQMLYIDTRASLPDDLLMVGDKTSMANSLEVRVPFLDVRLVEFVESLDIRWKLRGFTGKYLHKQALLKWLPKEVVFRKKKGFAHPIGEWFRTSMRGMLEEVLLSKDAGIGQYFDQEVIAQTIRRHAAGRDDCTRHLFLLLSLELWHQSFFQSSCVPSGLN